MEFEYFSDDINLEDLEVAAEEVTVAFCSDKNTQLIIGKSQMKKKRKRQTEPKPNAGHLQNINISSVYKEALKALSEKEMLQQLYSATIKRLLDAPSPNLDFLSKRLEDTVAGKAVSLDKMWQKFHQIWTDNEIVTQLQDCLEIEQGFSSWLIFECQEVIAKQNYAITEDKEVEKQILSSNEKEVVTCICGAILNKLTKKTYDNMRKVEENKTAYVLLKERLEVLNACKGEEGKQEGSTRLISTLTRGGLTYPKESFAKILEKTELVF
ncbi:uncharacterized protein LOC135693864 [Rhopilema esculentum]|uniref:uncharacterized protein LOC135693864 n=1 Tax=Rhopilema esculentum TaxID=499914 RepID=UPI0031CDFFD1